MASIRLITQCVLVLTLVYMVSAIPNRVHVGGLAGEYEPSDEVREAVQSVRKEIEEQAKETYTSIEPLSYRRQIVAGINYFVKAAANKANGEQTYLHLRIYKPIRGPTELTSMLKDVSRQKPLEHFQ